jgi:hypothetical protein
MWRVTLPRNKQCRVGVQICTPTSEQPDVDLGRALVAYQLRAGELKPDFLAFILGEWEERRREVCGWCGMTLRRHVIAYLRNLSDRHKFREINLN